MTGPAPGPGVDDEGRPVLDPTRNVLDLVDAAVKRVDDLREAETRHLREILKLRWEHQQAVERHQDRIVSLLTQHDNDVDTLRSYFGKELREAESKRIDAIRAVDVSAVQRAAEVSATQAQTLANQVAVSAEALRAQVAAAQSAAATSLAAALDPIQKDIADLRRAQYEQAGSKAQVVEGRSSNAAMVAVIGVGLTLLIIVIAVIGLVVSTKK
jgi:hypothetical protein